VYDKVVKTPKIILNNPVFCLKIRYFLSKTNLLKRHAFSLCMNHALGFLFSNKYLFTNT